MTKPCEKLFDKLPRNQQIAIKEKVALICKDPNIGYKLKDVSMQGLRHDHIGSNASNVLVVWSVDEKKNLVIVEGVGSHHMMENLQNQRKRIGYGF